MTRDGSLDSKQYELKHLSFDAHSCSNCAITITCTRIIFILYYIYYYYPRRSRSAVGVDIVLTLDVCLYVCMYVSALERKRLIGMT